MREVVLTPGEVKRGCFCEAIGKLENIKKNQAISRFKEISKMSIFGFSEIQKIYLDKWMEILKAQDGFACRDITIL